MRSISGRSTAAIVNDARKRTTPVRRDHARNETPAARSASRLCVAQRTASSPWRGSSTDAIRAKPDFVERRDDRREVERAFAERQVLVDARPHVLERDREQAVPLLPDDRRGIPSAVTSTWPTSRLRPSRFGRAERGVELAEGGDGLDEHAGLGLEREVDAASRRRARRGGRRRRAAARTPRRPASARAARPTRTRRNRRRGRRRRRSRCARSSSRARRPGSIRPGGACCAGRGGTARRTRRRRRGRAPSSRLRSAAVRPVEVRRERVEVVDVERERDRAVAEARDDVDRVLEPVVGEAARRISDPESSRARGRGHRRRAR